MFGVLLSGIVSFRHFAQIALFFVRPVGQTRNSFMTQRSHRFDLRSSSRRNGAGH